MDVIDLTSDNESDANEKIPGESRLAEEKRSSKKIKANITGNFLNTKRKVSLPESLIPLKIKQESKPKVEMMVGVPSSSVVESVSLSFGSDPYYWRILKDMIFSCLADSYEGSLIKSSHRQKLLIFTQALQDAQKLSIRLYLRKHGCLRESSLKYTEFGESISNLISELERSNIVVRPSHDLEINDLLSLLRAPELSAIATKLKIQKKTASNLKDDIVKLCNQKCVFSSKSLLHDKVRKICLPYITECFKLAKWFINALNAAVFVFTMFTPNLIGPDIFATSGIVYQVLNFTRNPLISIQRNVAVFNSAEEFQLYMQLSTYINDINQLMIEKEYAKCLCLIKKATVCFSKLNQDNTENSSKIVPKYLTRFSNRNLVKRLTFLEIECHSKLKGYAVAARCIETLISKKQLSQRKLGEQYDRLALIYDSHLYDRYKCIQTIENALLSNILPFSQLSVAERAHRLLRKVPKKEKPGKVPANKENVVDIDEEKAKKTLCWDCFRVESKCCQILETYSMKLILEMKVFARSSPHARKEQRARFLYRSIEDDSTIMCTVEDYVLADVKDRLNFKFGLHREGALFETLFFALMADIVFSSEISNVFFSEYQTRPLDWMTPDFLESRQELMERRYDELKSSERRQEIVQLNFENFPNAVNWTIHESGVPELVELIEVFDINQIKQIFEKILTDCSFSGMPDLTFWARRRDETEGNDPKKKLLLLEVKGPGDTLSYKQIVWLHFFKSIGVDAQVARVTTTQNELD